MPKRSDEILSLRKTRFAFSPNHILDRKKASNFKYKKLSLIIQRRIEGKRNKSFFFNNLRNNTFQLVLSSLRYKFKSKPSILMIKRIENSTFKLFLKVKSLKLFLFNYANMGTYKCAPVFVLTI